MDPALNCQNIAWDDRKNQRAIQIGTEELILSTDLYFRTTTGTSGGSLLCFGSVQVMISKRPSSCSASAVQLSTQSPQFI
jgi:hypothetical protein